MQSVNDFRWLSADYAHVEGMDDAAEYRILEAAWETMGVSREQVLLTYRVAAAIMHLGNATFTESRRSEDAQADDACRAALDTASELLGLPAGALAKAILKPRLKAGLEWVNKSRTAAQAMHVVEALAKSLYDRLFAWIVDRINVSLLNRHKRELFIGVLDISGFEIFEVNSLEQLCINYTNEKLQQLFNNHMFKLEQEEYLREGIEWDMVDFGLDLEPTIELIESSSSPVGILALLNEECTFPKASDETFVEKLVANLSGAVPFAVPKFSKTKFSVAHYAGTVEYSADEWLEKNRDKLDDPITVVMQDSSIEFVGDLFADLHPDREGARSVKRGKKARARPTIAANHKSQLLALMTTLRSTTPHFIRCIKPNEEKRPGHIDAHMVLDQLRCNGVLEGIRICRKGFPNRVPFAEFRDRYKILAPGKVPDSMLDSKKACTIIIEHVGMEASQYRIGHTKVFFKAGRLPELEELRDRILSKMLVKIQGVIRGHLARKQYQITLTTSRATALVQQSIRSFIKARDWGWWQLFAKIRPMLKHQDIEAEMAEKEAAVKEAERKLKDSEAKAQTLSAELADAAIKLDDAREKFKREKDALRDNYEAQLEDLSHKNAQLVDARATDRAAAAAQLQLARDDAAAKIAAAKDAAARAADDASRARDQAAADALALEQQLRAQAKADVDAANKAATAAADAVARKHDTALRELSARLEKAKADAARSSAASTEASAEIDTLRAKLRDANALIAKLEADLDDTATKLSSADSARAALATQVSSLESQLTAESSAKLAMEQAKLLLETQAADLAAQLDGAKSSLATADAKNKSLLAELSEAQDDLALATRKALDAEKTTKKLKKELAEVQAAATAAASDAARSKRAASKAAREARAAKASAPAAESAAPARARVGAGAGSGDTNATLKINNLKLAHDATLRRLDAAQDQIEALSAEIDSARAETRDALNDAAAAENAKAVLVVELAEEEALVDGLRAELEGVRAELDAARAAATDADAHTEAIVARKAKRWQISLEQTREQLEDALTDKAVAEAALDAEKRAHSETKAELQELMVASSTATSSVSGLRRELAPPRRRPRRCRASATRHGQRPQRPPLRSARLVRSSRSTQLLRRRTTG
ncbi:Myh9 protein [Thecamonas trahens ATCC 50062]|uniref:Myh9 protein n=1 Tax=Thecamonas trahens ATCC 50062 TaxID=461836 RepID=A0A0L0DKI9_THETB|nr:Myh9 protein [Thecamonas trahens ATCC 50062]KNC52904.1 Myh9 protein [Thecamonas trahens ATCC 50062]|eukprot:XP_013754998.1 Myh9 protein [Thecamonas trahens ATCC 50062]